MASQFLCWRNLANLIAGLLVSLLASVPGVAATIDDFDDGSIVVERTGTTAAMAQQSGLSTEHVIGGARDFLVGEFGGPVQRITVDAPASELRFTTDTNGYFTINYGSAQQPLNVNLAANGENAFVIEAAYTHPQFPTTSLPGNRIAVYYANGSGVTSTSAMGSSNVALADGSRVIRIPFASLGAQIDVTAIERIEIEFFRVPVGAQLTLRRIATVPEPTSATLLLAVIAVAGAGRRASARGATFDA